MVNFGSTFPLSDTSRGNTDAMAQKGRVNHLGRVKISREQAASGSVSACDTFVIEQKQFVILLDILL